MEQKWGLNNMLITLGGLKEGYNEITNMQSKCQDMMMDIGVHKIQKGRSVTFFEEIKETAINILNGHVTFEWQSKSADSIRRSVFDEGPSVLHFPCMTEVVMEAIADSEVLIQKTTNDRSFPVRHLSGTDIRYDVWGEGIWDETAKRNVRFIIEYKSSPYSNLVMGEVINYPGRWSTFIPHTHDHPEVYFYRFDRENGFGAGFVGDDVFKTRHNSATCIRSGMPHPQTSAPGYAMYYCWMMRHLEDNPFTSKIEDDRYKWLFDQDVKIWPNK
ncbi:MAG: 5-deoxy-glucuronate isomerase [Bacillota bacterium]|nr:5-deoxy-glucuronate isomerase [Bacillota bacterium]MDW7678507.1 5-deoxy-glucuronate isomerase [Bacillota bacterium]